MNFEHLLYLFIEAYGVDDFEAAIAAGGKVRDEVGLLASWIIWPALRVFSPDIDERYPALKEQAELYRDEYLEASAHKALKGLFEDDVRLGMLEDMDKPQVVLDDWALNLMRFRFLLPKQPWGRDFADIPQPDRNWTYRNKKVMAHFISVIRDGYEVKNSPSMDVYKKHARRFSSSLVSWDEVEDTAETLY